MNVEFIEKLLKSDIYCVWNGGEILYFSSRHYKATIGFDDDLDVSLFLDEIYAVHPMRFEFKLSEYGKTWAFTKEELK